MTVSDVAMEREADLTAPPIGLLRGASLFLDFDGTLVELAADPDSVIVGDRLRRLIATLASGMAGRIAIVSGRPADQVRAFLGGDVIVSGSHGAELLWRDGRRDVPALPEGLPGVVARMTALRARHADVLVETKPFGAALHFRRAPHAAADCEALASELATAPGFTLQRGKMMVEVRAAGAHKGDAVRTLMTAPDMAGTTPVFIGDDVTDEDAFAAAADLGGAGILVGPARATAARYRLDDVSAVLGWLERAIGDKA